jgi:anti-anti-sigma factor
MRAKINIKDGVTVISLEGYLDFETPLIFERDCLKRIATPHVVFDFGGLNFIGSSGLTSFLQTIGDFTKTAKGEIRFARVGIEFKRLMIIGEMSPTGFFNTVDSAFTSVFQPKEILMAKPAGPEAMDFQINDGWEEEDEVPLPENPNLELVKDQ